MRKALLVTATLLGLGSPVLGADLPNVKGPPVFAPPPPVFTWTGFYVGAQAGYEWGRTSGNLYTDPGVFIEGLPGYSASGVVGGAHVGYNYQVSQFVFGLEGDIEGSSYSGTGGPVGAPAPFTAYTTRIPIQGSVRGRIGIAWDRVLFYATGGVEFADIRTSFTTAAVPAVVGVAFAPGAPAGFDSFSSGRLGWTIGGGMEYAIDPNWSVRAEYRYTDFGRFDDFLVTTHPGDFARLHIYDNAVRVGFSYKFDLAPPPTPVVAKY